MTEPCTLSYRAISQYAEQLGAKYGLDEPAPDLTELVHQLGGRVEYADVRESSIVERQGDFTIFLPKHTSRRRDRFTIAHELGHYFLHYRLPNHSGRKVFGRGERNVAETQANVFAASLLMPAAAFKQAWRDMSGNKVRVAAQFEVSPDAASVRASVLQLQ